MWLGDYTQNGKKKWQAKFLMIYYATVVDDGKTVGNIFLFIGTYKIPVSKRKRLEFFFSNTYYSWNVYETNDGIAAYFRRGVTYNFLLRTSHFVRKISRDRKTNWNVHTVIFPLPAAYMPSFRNEIRVTTTKSKLIPIFTINKNVSYKVNRLSHLH